MKKINTFQWNLYKSSAQGAEAIALFDKLSGECTTEEMLAVAERFNPQYFKNLGVANKKALIAGLDAYDELFSVLLNEENAPQNLEEAISFYTQVSAYWVTNQAGAAYDELPESYFKDFLCDNLIFTTMLHAYMPSMFVPNFYPMQFFYLKKLADKYELDLPEIPNRKDYKARWTYYLEINCMLIDFAVQNGFESMSEFCAFLFDYELAATAAEASAEERAMPEITGQAWILVGNYGEGERDMEYGFWQANELTEKGDILLFYEKSPVKALNSVWIAQQDGVVDPFFHYYSNTYIGQKISIPADKAISFADFKESEYFKNRTKKGNFVSKNFQDVSGWAVSYEDYREIKRMLEARGFDTSVLPQLYEPTAIGDVVIERESDVSTKLLIPLLEQMGWRKGLDFRAEVEFNAGRGTTGNQINKRPDFCLHIVETNDDIEAKVAIEVKKLMKNNKEIHDNFVQGRSYAKWGAVEVLVLCDMRQILVYPKGRNGRFDESKFVKFSWTDMENPDKYNELKHLLS